MEFLPPTIASEYNSDQIASIAMVRKLSEDYYKVERKHTDGTIFDVWTRVNSKGRWNYRQDNTAQG